MKQTNICRLSGNINTVAWRRSECVSAPTERIVPVLTSTRPLVTSYEDSTPVFFGEKCNGCTHCTGATARFKTPAPQKRKRTKCSLVGERATHDPVFRKTGEAGGMLGRNEERECVYGSNYKHVRRVQLR